MIHLHSSNLHSNYLMDFLSCQCPYCIHGYCFCGFRTLMPLLFEGLSWILYVKWHLIVFWLLFPGPWPPLCQRFQGWLSFLSGPPLRVGPLFQALFDAFLKKWERYSPASSLKIPADFPACPLFHYFININQSFKRFSLTEPEPKRLIIYNMVFNKTKLQQTASGVCCVRIAIPSPGKYCLAELID